MLRGHESKEKILSIGGHFQGSRSGRELVSGEGEFAGEERREASDRIAGGKKVILWVLWSPLMMHLRVSTVKAVKGW